MAQLLGETLVTVKDLSKTYADREILRHMSFTVHRPSASSPSPTTTPVSVPAEKVAEYRSEPPPPQTLREDEKIIEALRQANGNRAKAAKILGIARSTLYRQMQRYNISN